MIKKRFTRKKTTFAVVVFIGVGLTGCMVGPTFHAPASPQIQAYTRSPFPKKTVSVPTAGNAGKSQYFISGQNIPAQWWALFHSPTLDTLVQQGLINSPNLAAAEATLQQAEDTLNAQVGSLLVPAIDGVAGAQRSRTANSSIGANTPPQIFSVYDTSVKVSYTLDLFGGSRRQIETYAAQVDYQRYQLIAAYLTLTSNVVTTTITVASLEAQIQATQQLIDEEKKQLDIVEKQLRLGGTSVENVLLQQTQLEQTQATLPPLEKSLAQSRHALAVLVGNFPSQGSIPPFDLDALNLPAQLPVSLPSCLVRQRPDVQAAEALLHVASAKIGVATANMLPQITLTGNYGTQANAPSELFEGAANIWAIGGQLAQPLFHGGELWFQRKAAIAGYEQALAQYQETVLQAFQNVADSLRAIEIDALEFQAQKQAEIAARDTLTLTEKQFRLGGASYLTLLTAEQQYQRARISRIQAQVARYTDTAALFQALGGGWFDLNWRNNK